MRYGDGSPAPASRPVPVGAHQPTAPSASTYAPFRRTHWSVSSESRPAAPRCANYVPRLWTTGAVSSIVVPLPRFARQLRQELSDDHVQSRLEIPVKTLAQQGDDVVAKVDST